MPEKVTQDKHVVYCYSCGAFLMGGATQHTDACEIKAMIEEVLHPSAGDYMPEVTFDVKPANIWMQRAQEVLADDEAKIIAGILYYLVVSHLQSCTHTRRCPEDTLMEEAQRLAKVARQ